MSLLLGLYVFSTVITTPQYNSIEDIAKAGSKYSRDLVGYTKDYFTSTLDPIATQVAPKFVSAPAGPVDGMTFLRTAAVDAYITMQPVADYYTHLEPCDTQVSFLFLLIILIILVTSLSYRTCMRICEYR